MAAYCVLTYPTLEHWLSAPLDSDSNDEPGDSAHSAILRAAESTSTHLTVIVKTAESALPNPWDLEPTATSSSKPSDSSGAATASTPTRFFLRLERALAHVYSIATDSFAQRDLVLAQIDVVLDQLRRQPVCIPSSATTVIRWHDRDDFADDPANENENGNAHKGKGKECTPTPAAANHHHHDPEIKPLYPVVALGGTFDHLHSGHKILLTMAASITSRKLIVGVTGPSPLSLFSGGSFLCSPASTERRTRNPLHERQNTKS